MLQVLSGYIRTRRRPGGAPPKYPSSRHTSVHEVVSGQIKHAEIGCYGVAHEGLDNDV